MTDDSLQEQQVIEALKQGQTDLLADYILGKERPLSAFIDRNMSIALKKKLEPADILQEVTISALKSFSEIDFSQKTVFSWLCNLAERRIIDAHRTYVAAQKRSANKEQAIDAGGGQNEQGLVDMLAASMTSASMAYHKVEQEYELREALTQLTEEQQKAINYRYIQKLSSKEVAALLNKSDGATRVLLSRTLSQLQGILAENTIFKSFIAQIDTN